jgi:urease accessory protein
LRADYDGRPLLRHDVTVDGADGVSLGPAVLAGHRAYGTVLRAGESGAPVATQAHPDVSVMPLAGPGVLVSALAADSLALRQLLDAMTPHA